jgi:mRNA interferase HicA
MKRRDLVAKLEEAGCVLLRHGAKHDIYHSPKNGRSEPVPRHREINEFLAKKILKSLARSEDEQMTT